MSLDILAIDPSLHSSGWCYLVDGVPWECGVVTTSYPGAKGLSCIAPKIALLKERLPRPDRIVLEKSRVFGKFRADTAIILGQAAGVWIGVFAPVSVEVVENSVWGAFHKLPKESDGRKMRMQQIAWQIAPELDWGEDNADALGIGLWAWGTR